MTPQIQLFFSKTGRSVRLAHPLFTKPKSLRLTNPQREKVLDLIRHHEQRAILFIESLLLLQKKGGAK